MLLIVTGLFGLFTAREVVKFRSNLTTLRGREAELATLMEMEPAESPPPDHDPPDGRAEGEDDRDDRPEEKNSRRRSERQGSGH